MERKIVFSCSCFIDQSNWFINSAYYSWMFDKFVYANGVLSDDLFIYHKKFTYVVTGINVEYVTEIVACCLDCFKFLLRYSSGKKEIINVFNEIDCHYVYEEAFCYNSTIYVGNDRFQFDRNDEGDGCKSTK